MPAWFGGGGLVWTQYKSHSGPHLLTIVDNNLYKNVMKKTKGVHRAKVQKLNIYYPTSLAQVKIRLKLVFDYMGA